MKYTLAGIELNEAPTTLLESLLQQVKLEGEGMDTPTPEHHKMLLQKFGLIAPVLTASEKQLIAREERQRERRYSRT